MPVVETRGFGSSHKLIEDILLVKFKQPFNKIFGSGQRIGKTKVFHDKVAFEINEDEMVFLACNINTEKEFFL